MVESPSPLSKLVAAIMSPLALLRLPARTWLLLLTYLAACAGLLALCAYLLTEHKEWLRGALLDYLFPDSWDFAANWLMDKFLLEQQRQIIVNLIITGSLFVVTITLFPLKEAVSASFEKSARLTKEPMKEHPLWEQGWQEIKLFALFIAVQGTIFWLGYGPSKVRGTLAWILSYGFLFFTFAIDFAAPLFQRHLGHYSQIIKTLAKAPVASLAFGAIFAMPAIVVGNWVAAGDSFSFNTTIIAVFSVNVILIAWAAVSGTWWASRLFNDFSSAKRASAVGRGAAWVVVVGMLSVNGYLFGSLGLSLHHKSQILKLDYDVAWASFGFDRPKLGALLGGDVDVGVHFDLEIHNPTPFDVEIEDNRIELTHNGDVVAKTRIPTMKVDSKDTVTERINLALQVKAKTVLKGRELFDRDLYKVTLYVQVTDRFEFPIYLLE